ncbi:hypothetical protein SAMN05192541_120119 [Bradyrhizobium arachidis]|nr:hypothetical protein SAMN05192541_120119 [Bradyrhizobium arachidis]
MDTRDQGTRTAPSSEERKRLPEGADAGGDSEELQPPEQTKPRRQLPRVFGLRSAAKCKRTQDADRQAIRFGYLSTARSPRRRTPKSEASSPSDRSRVLCHTGGQGRSPHARALLETPSRENYTRSVGQNLDSGQGRGRSLRTSGLRLSSWRAHSMRIRRAEQKYRSGKLLKSRICGATTRRRQISQQRLGSFRTIQDRRRIHKHSLLLLIRDNGRSSGRGTVARAKGPARTDNAKSARRSTCSLPSTAA